MYFLCTYVKVRRDALLNALNATALYKLYIQIIRLLVVSFGLFLYSYDLLDLCNVHMCTVATVFFRLFFEYAYM